ncbi:MAG: hypothetical protein JNJ78_22780 [Anaerolineae bacterium]|nr:hypothetical protein [Anaerolineae bacterium]
MLFRKLFSAAAALVTGLTLALTALPQQVTYACLPCACPTNTSINCYGDYALYTKVQRNGTCNIEVLGINPKTGKPRQALYVTAATLAKLSELPETNTLIKSYYEFALYKLTTGEYQLNVGPDFENKVHVIIWTGCPAENPYESSFVQTPQQ